MKKRILTLAAAALASLALPVIASQPTAEAVSTKPNIVLVLIDDGRFDDTRVMPDVVNRIGDAGATFTNFYSSFPLCCPARATLLSGQYPHNHGVLSNAQPTGGWKEFKDSSTLATWLDPTYRTALVGKYFNEYSPPYQPPGWNEWMVPVGMYNYTTSRWYVNNGSGGAYKTISGYSTDTIANLSADFINRASAGSEPFFLYTSIVAPHDGSPRESDDIAGCPSPYVKPVYQNFFAGMTNTDPSFNEADVSDKTLKPAPLTADEIACENEAIQQRRESELSVQDATNKILNTLIANGVLDNTYVMFMSDNGYILGEHRMRGGKLAPYEVSNHVPFMMRGPGIVPGTRVARETAQVDFASTVLDIADADPGLPQDGISLLPAATGTGWVNRDGILIEATDTTSTLDPLPWQYNGIVYGGWKYIERTSGRKELYDLTADPYELDNQANKADYAAKQAELKALLDAKRWCQGASCR